MAKIAKFCIRHKVTTILAFIIVAVFGAVYTGNLQMSLLPNMSYPAAVVYSYYNGAGPEDIEQLVARPIEGAVMSVPGVKSVSSNSSEGSCSVVVMYENGTDVDLAANKLRERFDLLSLPDGAIDPVIVNINISEMMPTAIIALMGNDLTATQTLAEDVVVPALERIDGVASVSISGGRKQQISVELNSAKASGYNLSTSYVSQILAAENLLYPGGNVDNGKQSLTVSTDAKLKNVQDVRTVLIPLPTGGSVRLSEVADVELVTADPDGAGKMNGVPALVVQVSKSSGANEVTVSRRISSALEKLAEENSSVRYEIPYIASDYIMLAVNSALENIGLGVLIAAVIVFIFLRRFGATLAIAVSMPVCILTVFALMYAADLTMNMMSLGGIAMGVGMIVDNSIVVLENIYRRRAEGGDRMTACVDGTKEVFLSLTASTLTTVAVFLPLGLTDGLAGQIFKDFCLTIVFLILSSLVIAVTLVPLLCYFLLDENKAKEYQLRKLSEKGLGEKIFNGYKKVLAYFVRHVGQGLLVSVALLAAFVVVIASTQMSLLPDMDMGMIQINVSTPIGSSLDDNVAVCEQISAIVEENVKELESYYYMASDSQMQVEVNLVGKSKRSQSTTEVVKELRGKLADIAGAEITVSSMDMGAMMTGDEISVAVKGEDYETLLMISGELADRISALPDTVDITTSASEQIPQVHVTINRQAASQYGLTAASIGAAVRAQLTGSTATTVTINNKDIDVVVKGDGVSSSSLDALRSMPISSNYGGSIPLSSVASVDVVLSPNTITRNNQQRQITITGSTVSGSTAGVSRDILKILDSYVFPDGYSASIGGEYEDMMENFSDLGLAILVAIGLVYFVLASQFESFVMPVMIMMILPLAFAGALVILPFTGNNITMISLVALIILSGTVVNASIILVDSIKQRRDEGIARTDAILEACPLRVRPVLMTTLTTILALVPMALGLGESNEMLSSMGLAMISGMSISTVITLLFTPVYYCVIDNITSKFGKKRQTETEAA
ncbi:MAG: efflux RND transporter permease subunit [Firmicutes bacterium]|nr:efflux RND transporter permease subunit [Bacillota bacterium]